MNRLRTFIGSSSGLAPLRKWVVIALPGLVVLFGDKEAEADPARTYCDDSWTPLFRL